MQVLVQMSAKEYAKEVAALLNDPDPNTRKAALQVLVQMGAKEYAKEVAALLNDPAPNTRQAAMQVLVQKGAKEYAKEVAALLNDPAPNTRKRDAGAGSDGCEGVRQGGRRAAEGPGPVHPPSRCRCWFRWVRRSTPRRSPRC